MLDVRRSMLDVMLGALASSCVQGSVSLGVESAPSVCVPALGSEPLCASCARNVVGEPGECPEMFGSICHEGHECCYMAVYEHTMS